MPPRRATNARRASPRANGAARQRSKIAPERIAPSEKALRDVIAKRPRVLLIGINPGLRSGAIGHHFAGQGNPFWRLLYAAGIVPELLSAEEDERLAEFGIALTNICPRVTRTAAELTTAELVAGRRALARKIEKLRPLVVAFVGLSVFQAFFGLKKSGGAGPKAERVAGARVFVVPNPSGLNASYPGFRDKLVWYEALRAFVDNA
jgi:TDG/mug DNA glycosylase family protein